MRYNIFQAVLEGEGWQVSAVSWLCTRSGVARSCRTRHFWASSLPSTSMRERLRGLDQALPRSVSLSLMSSRWWPDTFMCSGQAHQRVVGAGEHGPVELVALPVQLHRAEEAGFGEEVQKHVLLQGPCQDEMVPIVGQTPRCFSHSCCSRCCCLSGWSPYRCWHCRWWCWWRTWTCCHCCSCCYCWFSWWCSPGCDCYYRYPWINLDLHLP